jgi:hypothetical protein
MSNLIYAVSCRNTTKARHTNQEVQNSTTTSHDTLGIHTDCFGVLKFVNQESSSLLTNTCKTILHTSLVSSRCHIVYEVSMRLDLTYATNASNDC